MSNVKNLTTVRNPLVYSEGSDSVKTSNNEFRDEVERLEAGQAGFCAALEKEDNILRGPQQWFEASFARSAGPGLSSYFQYLRLEAQREPVLADACELVPADARSMTMMAAPMVWVTIIENLRGPATKIFSDHDGEQVIEGKLYKKSAAQIYEGRVERRQVAGVRGLLVLENKLKSTKKSGQALLYGATEAETARVITQKALKKLNGSSRDGIVARDAEHCPYAEGEPGIFMGDYDPRPGYPPLSAQELDDILCGLFPQLAAVERVWRPSATAFIFDREGNELKGSWGWRLYFVVDDASQIPRIGAAIYQALWAAGHGYIKLTKSGGRRDYSLLDSYVWQGERLDFAAPPIFKDGLMRMLPDELGDLGALIFPGEPMLRADTIAEVPAMAEWRKMSPELAAAKGDKKIKRESAKVLKAYTNECADEIEKKGGAKVDRKAFAATIRKGCIPVDLILYPEDGEPIRAGDLFKDPAKWHEARFAEPFDRNYGNDPRIAIAYMDHPACIVSHAHGRNRYVLEVPPGVAPVVEPKAAQKTARIEAAGLTAVRKPEIKRLVLLRDDNNKIIKDQRNFRLIAGHELWEFSYNEFTGKKELAGLAGYPQLDDAAFAKIRQHCASQYYCKFDAQDIREIISVIAREGRYHPVRDYLDALEWDKIKRLDSWLPSYFGAENNPTNRAIGRKTLIAAVRRARHPGCQCKYMMVLEGEQDQGKSKGLAALCPDPLWFTDNFSLEKHVDSKRVIELTRGKMIVEISELDMKRGDVERIKGMLSRNTDEDRLAYGHERTEVPRAFIFIGTCNRLVLPDTTGNVRFWPIKCIGQIDDAAIKRDRDQLWAEAAYYKSQGEAIHLTKADAIAAKGIAAAQKEHEAGDEFHNALALWASDTYAGDALLLREIALDVLHIPMRDLKKDAEMRIGTALGQLGFVRKKSNGIARWKQIFCPFSPKNADDSDT